MDVVLPFNKFSFLFSVIFYVVKNRILDGDYRLQFLELSFLKSFGMKNKKDLTDVFSFERIN